MIGARHAKKLVTVIVLALVSSPTASGADDNLLAYRLYQQGQYAQAAEIFTDPAWKGMALYQSSQWWRAAEAFIRANDALSAYNLGNCYVELGYYELALQAYQRALSLDSSLKDAQHNADIMLALLALDDDERQRGGRQTSGDELEQIESDNIDEGGGQGNTGEDDSSSGDNAAGEANDDNAQSAATDEEAQAGNGGEAGEQNQARENQSGDGGALDGKATEEESDDNRASGGSESNQLTQHSAAAGLRTNLESEQAITQWLNSIEHNPQLFLQSRLRLEQKRRRAAGQSPPQGGSTW